MKHLAIVTALLINALALFVLAAVLASPDIRRDLIGSSDAMRGSEVTEQGWIADVSNTPASTVPDVYSPVANPGEPALKGRTHD